MINSQLNALSVSLILFIIAAGYFVFRYVQQLTNRHNLSKHRHVCEILNLDGFIPELNFTRIPQLWQDYSFRGTYDRYSFEQAVVKKFASKVKEMPDIERVVGFLLTYTEVQHLQHVSIQDKEMISKIYTALCREIETTVMLLGHQRYNKLKVMHKGELKDRLMMALGDLLDNSCIKNFFPLSKNILDLETRELLAKANFARKGRKPEAPIVEMKDSSSPAVSAES